MSQYKMKIHGQYIKDLSFENPNSPFLFAKDVPSINVMVNINSARLENSEVKEVEIENEKKSFYEITLHIEAKARIKDDNVKDNTVFICEMKYCAILVIENFIELSTEDIRQALFIDGPTFLFPFAREIIARITSSGGFPALMLDPIDFKAMYKQQNQE